MSIDTSSEETFSLTKAARRIPGKPHIATVWRWATRGVKGVKLESLLIGGRRYTSAEALERFYNAINAAADRQPTPRRTARQREQAIARAERELRDAGI